jgi:integrase
MSETVEALQARIEQLQQQLARRSRAAPIEYLGESLSADVLPELASARKLSAAAVKTRGEGMHGDGGNLWLQVTPGGRSWVFRYRWGSKQREMGLGAVGDVPLGEARGRAAICRRLVRAGVDPIERRRELTDRSALAEIKRITFGTAIDRYIASHRPSWKNDKHVAQWLMTVGPQEPGEDGKPRGWEDPERRERARVLRSLPVDRVDVDDVLKVVEPLWNTNRETARRVRGRIETVLYWATARGQRKGDNPARWRGHMDKLLPARSRAMAVKHHAALAWTGLSAFWNQLGAHGGSGVEALRFTILTGARTGEVIGATWAEIDLAGKIWTVPAERMKAGREHRVPLSAEAVAILERMRPLANEGQPYLFPGRKAGKPLSNMAMLMLLKKMGRADLTTHGFRSAFKDWASESTAYAGDLVEMALAHAIGNKVEAAYRRGDMFDKRRRLMEDWAAHCTTTAATGGNVHRIGEAR